MERKMALKMSKQFMTPDFVQRSGEYWTIYGYQYSKFQKMLAVQLAFYTDEASYRAGDDPVGQFPIIYNDFTFDYSKVEEVGSSELRYIYRKIKLDVERQFDLAEDV